MALLGWSPTSTLLVIAIVLFFLIAIANKFLNMFIPFNKWIAWPATLVPFFAIGYLWAAKPALAIGLICGLVGGILGGISLGGSDDGD